MSLLNRMGIETGLQTYIELTATRYPTRLLWLPLRKTQLTPLFPSRIPEWGQREGKPFTTMQPISGSWSNLLCKHGNTLGRSLRGMVGLAKQLILGWPHTFCPFALYCSLPSLPCRRSFYSFSEQKFSEGERWDFHEHWEYLIFWDAFQHVLFICCQKKHFIIFSLVKVFKEHA